MLRAMCEAACRQSRERGERYGRKNIATCGAGPCTLDFSCVDNFNEVDAALDALMVPTPGMLATCHDNADWYGGLQGWHKDEERAGRDVLQGMIQAVKEGK